MEKILLEHGPCFHRQSEATVKPDFRRIVEGQSSVPQTGSTIPLPAGAGIKALRPSHRRDRVACE
jgi:hypothetical protein